MTPVDRTAPSQAESISFEFDLHHLPEKVWRALTDPALLAEWLLPVLELELEPGAAFRFKTQPQPGWDGIVNCRFLEIEAHRKLRYAWVVGDMDTVVTFTLTPTASGTRLSLVQSGFRPEQKQNFGGARYGWKMMGGKLVDLLARNPMSAKSESTPRAGRRKGGKVAAVLSGGNPRIAKADGDAPVQAYIAGMPGWKRELGKRIDALIARNVPNLRKAVKWNSPFYGIEGQGWFLSFHTFTRYVKVAFFRGTSLRPVPPGPSKSKDTRYIDIHEGEELDEAQMADWVKQAAALPGWVP